MEALYTIPAILIIIISGFITLIIANKAIINTNFIVLLALSWLTGCVTIAFLYTLTILLELVRLQFSPLLLSLVYLISCIYMLSRNDSILHDIKDKLSINVSVRHFSLDHNKVIFIVTLLPVISFILVLFMINALSPMLEWDAFMNWTLKAKLAYYNRLTTGFFLNKQYFYSQLDYPLLAPLIQAYIAKFTGIFDVRATKIFFSFTLVSFVILLYNFISSYLGKSLSLLFIIAVLPMPVLFWNFVNSNADGVLMAFHLLAVINLYLYLSKDTNQPNLMLAAIGISGMLITKNEGMVYTIVLYVISILIIYLFYKNFKQRFFIISNTFIIAVIFYLPWALFINIYGVRNVEHFNIINLLLSPELFNNLKNIPSALYFLVFENLFKIGNWGILFIIYFITFFIGLKRKLYLPFTFFTGAILLNIAIFIFVYINSPIGTIHHMLTSADRITLSLLPLVLCYIPVSLSSYQDALESTNVSLK